MNRFFALLLTVFLLVISGFNANAAKKFPSISGDILMQLEGDRILSSQREGISDNNSYIYVESNINFNINRNWSVKTNWRLQPLNTLTTRDQTYPERYRTFLQEDRGLNIDQTGLLIEELKINFENEDLQFSVGKFDPKFGVSHNKAKRMGVFTSQFTEDYNLREKLGLSLAALLENSKITINSFFTDTTGMSQSAIKSRSRARRSDGLASNTGTLSSYSVSMDGTHLFGIDDWVYNIGFRSLAVDNYENNAREQGYSLASEYHYKISHNTSLIPFLELVKIDNFTGEEDRNANYTTAALIATYSSWTASVSKLRRSIKQPQRNFNINDRQLQLTIGYKFTNNITFDVSRSRMKEGGYRASMVGATLSYFHEF